MLSPARALRHACRRLSRAPAFTIAAVLTLALGIGATTAVFSVVNGVLLRPLPYDHPEQLVDLSHSVVMSGVSQFPQSDATYLFYRRENRVFTDIAAYQANAVNLGPMSGAPAGGEGRPERVVAGRVTASLFSVLRVSALRGRALSGADDRPGAAPVVIISHRLWERKYGADPGVLGRRLTINGVSREVIGIMPASFRFPDAATELWLPLIFDPANTSPASFNYNAVARLKPGVTLQAAAADLQRVLLRLPEAYPSELTAAAIAEIHMRPVVQPLRDTVVGDIGRVLWVVLGTVGFVLLIACANVGNLFLVRAEGRQKELAVRRALGAGRAIVLSEFFSEGFVLAALGGVLGLALAVVGTHVLQSLGAGMDIPRLADVRVDGVVLAFAAAITLIAALFFSALPAVRSDAVGLSAILGETGRSATVGRERHRARNALVIAQVALALVLLTGSGLMARSFARLRSVKPGFDPMHVLTFRVTLPYATYPSNSGAAARFFVRALHEIARVPGVQAVGITSKVPLDDEGQDRSAVWVEDHPTPAGGVPDAHPNVYATAGYFQALRIPLVAGRLFGEPVLTRGPSDVIVSRAFAERYWKGESATTKHVRQDAAAPGAGPWYDIVGVVGSVRGATLEQPPQETVYYPLIIVPGSTPLALRSDVAFVVRTAGNPTQVAASMRRIVHDLDPALPVYHMRPMTDIVSAASARTSLTLLLLGVASVVALVLGAVGIYGVISYMVSLRTREIGIRLAVGAEPAAVRRMILRQGTAVAGLGILAGLIGSVTLTRFLAALLFDISPTDPVTLLGSAALLIAVVIAASWIPARRAAGVDPALALRAE